MRHRVRGRKLGRNASHRRAMFKNMACSLIRSVRVDEDDPRRPKVPGRIITTLPKAKELRPYVEKLITLAKKAQVHEEAAAEFSIDAQRNSDAWRQWRESDNWQKWAAAIAPAVALRRRAFAILRDNEAVDILFNELAERFEDRQGGYTRVIRLATVRLGDAGQQALIEFVGDRDRVKTRRRAPLPAAAEVAPIAKAAAAETQTETATNDEATPQAEASSDAGAQDEEKAE